MKVSFFRYRYALLKPLFLWSGCQLASLDDLAAMKLAAIYDRNTKKDFVDLHALMRTHATLPEMIAMFRAKYSTASVSHLLKALGFFEDADAEPMPVMFSRVRWEIVKEEIASEVSRFIKNQIT